MKSILSHLPLILAFALFFAMGCSGNSEKTTAKVAEDNTAIAANTPQGPTETEEAKQDTAEATTDTATVAQPSPGATEVVAPLEKTEAKPVVSTGGSGGLAQREVDEERLSVILDLIAQDLEAQKLEYKSELGQDCSGIYHKIKDLLQRKMKVLGDKSKYTYPTFTEDRNTRQIANWYYRHNNLYIVKDPLADRNKIRPGSVMFFARTEEKFNSPDIATLTNADVFQHDKAAGKGKIYHVGTVTKVEKDEQGNVVRYTLMHGRNSKYTASRTSGIYDGPGGYGTAFAKFPFGNWNQQWVAVAQIETPVE